MRSDFYVYVHRKADSGEVFYVGKGTGERAWMDRKSDHNQYWRRLVAKYGRTVEIVLDGLTEALAHELEREMIAYYGRDKLCNLTDGGEGVAGHDWSQERRANASRAQAKRFERDGERRRLADLAAIRFSDPAYRQKWKERQKATMNRPEVVEKMRLGQQQSAHRKKGSTGRFMSHKERRILCVETGVIFESAVMAAEWVVPHRRRANALISRVAAGVGKSAYGYRWLYVSEANRIDPTGV